MQMRTDKPITLTDESRASLSFQPPVSEARSGIGVAPLVDIVFLLICFYLFVTQSIQANEDPLIQLPVITNRSLADEQPAELVVNVAADGSISLNNRLVPLDKLRSVLNDQQVRATADGRPLTVVIRVDRRQRYRRFDQVLAACRQASHSPVLMRVTEADPP